MPTSGPIEPTQILTRDGLPLPSPHRQAQRRHQLAPQLRQLASRGLTPSAALGVAVTAALAAVQAMGAVQRLARRPLADRAGTPAISIRRFSGSALVGSELRVDWMHLEIRWPAR
jgi:hypothetical protein